MAVMVAVTMTVAMGALTAVAEVVVVHTPHNVFPIRLLVKRSNAVRTSMLKVA